MIMAGMMGPDIKIGSRNIADLDVFYIEVDSEGPVSGGSSNGVIYSPYYVFDDHLDVIAVYDPTLPSGEDSISFVRKFIDSSSLIAEVDATITERLASRDLYEVTVDGSDPQGNGWDDGGGMAYTFPVYLDGDPLASKYYMIAASYNNQLYSFSTEEEIYSELYRQELGFIFHPGLMIFGGGSEVYELNFSEKSHICESYTKSGRTYYGLYCYERIFDPADDSCTLIMIFDTPYHLVGYTFI